MSVTIPKAIKFLARRKRTSSCDAAEVKCDGYTSHWSKQARQWSLLGAPLKPSFCDIQNATAWMQEHCSANSSFNVLVLGVTPELVNIAWPRHTNLFALDCNLTMLESVLPTATPQIQPIAISGNWLNLPFESASFDLVIGDGCYTTLPLKEYATLTQEVKRILKSTGIFIMRFFSKLEEADSVLNIEADLRAGKITSFHAFKLRLAMTLQNDLNVGVCLNDVWNVWNEDSHHYMSLMKNLSWKEEVINTITVYQNNPTYYTFPTVEELRAVFKPYFLETAIFFPEYHLGDRCPSFKFSLA